jgi:hypothetical protein
MVLAQSPGPRQHRRMGKKPLPDLPDTGRHYLEHTARARLASPGIERFPPKRGRGAPLAVALLVAAALVATMLLLR